MPHFSSQINISTRPLNMAVAKAVPKPGSATRPGIIFATRHCQVAGRVATYWVIVHKQIHTKYELVYIYCISQGLNIFYCIENLYRIFVLVKKNSRNIIATHLVNWSESAASPYPRSMLTFQKLWQGWQPSVLSDKRRGDCRVRDLFVEFKRVCSNFRCY